MKLNNQPTEKQIQDEIIKRLKALGLFVWRNNSGQIPLSHKNKKGSFTTRAMVVGLQGMPDILGYLPSGRGFAIEVKRDPSKKPSEMQKLRINQLKNTGVLAFVATDPQIAEDTIKDLISLESLI